MPEDPAFCAFMLLAASAAVWLYVWVLHRDQRRRRADVAARRSRVWTTDEMAAHVHRVVVSRLDLSRIAAGSDREQARSDVRAVIGYVIEAEAFPLDEAGREDLTEAVLNRMTAFHPDARPTTLTTDQRRALMGDTDLH